MDRREFLKKAFQMGGVAALYRLGVSVEQAQAFGVLPAVVGGDASSLWADWDEASEDTLLVDQDGDGAEDTNVCFAENTSAGGDETSRGVTTGADLVDTQFGNIAGAVGSPPYRQLDGTDDNFEPSTNTMSIVSGSSTGTILAKVEDCANNRADATVFQLLAIANTTLARRDAATTKMIFYFRNTVVGSTANAKPTAGILYVFLFWDGVRVYGGFNETRPTKLSDIPAGNRKDIAYPGTLGAITSGRIGAHADGTQNYGQQKLYYRIFSSVCLIDTSA